MREQGGVRQYCTGGSRSDESHLISHNSSEWTTSRPVSIDSNVNSSSSDVAVMMLESRKYSAG